VCFQGREIRGNPEGLHNWRRAYLFENGDLLAVYEGLGLIKADKDSNILWAYDGHAHHDLDVMPNGDIYTLIRRGKRDPEPMAVDFVVLLDKNGKKKREWSVLDAVKNSEFAHIWNRKKIRKGDLFHTNSIRLLGDRAVTGNPDFAPGRVLTSMRRLNAIAVIDLETNRVVWAHQGDYREQHEPRILDSGNLLLFDNKGLVTYSRVIEFDPADMSEVWKFQGSADQPFLSLACGSAARLPNGNTLITETDGGRAFEILPDGKIVWEYYNIHRAGERAELIAAIFEMQRLEPDFPLDWLEDISGD